MRIAQELGHEEIAVRLITPPDEVEDMLRAALVRRQLTASQRAAVALKVVPYQQLREQATARAR